MAAVIALPEFATLHGASSPAPNAATYCTGYENPIEFNPNTGMASNQKQYAPVAAGAETQFTVTTANSCGNNDFRGGSVLIDAAPSSAYGTSLAGGCYIEWDPSGDVWLFGTSGADIAKGTLSNGQTLSIPASNYQGLDYAGCTVNLSPFHSWITIGPPGNPNAATITLGVTFVSQYNSTAPTSLQSFVGTHEVYAPGTNMAMIATGSADLEASP